MRGKIIIGLVLVIFLSSLAAAEVWINTQPSPIYNIGDSLEISIGVSEPGQQISAELECGNSSRLMFLKNLGEDLSTDIQQPLDNEFLGDLRGRCEVVVSYAGDSAGSSSFKITDNVFVDLKLNNRQFNPGETIEIQGESEKANGLFLNGFFEASFHEIGFTTSGLVQDGKFSINLTLPEDAPSGGYLINITTYEEDGEVTNTGTGKAAIGINQVPKQVDAALEAQTVAPGENISFKVMLFDQVGEVVEGEASFVIEDSNGEILLQTLTKINQQEYFPIAKNATSGYYRIKAYSAGLDNEREFYVEENQEAEFRVVDGTLIVENIGNVDYTKAIQVKIGETLQVINDKIGLGEQKKYSVVAPDGNYDIMITDGIKSVLNEGLSLTGKAISVKEIEKSFFSKTKSFVWVFLIIVLGLFIFVSGKRIIQKKFVLSDKPIIGRFIKKEKGPVKGKGVINVTPTKPLIGAEHSLVLKGHKQDTTLTCLRIKNQLTKKAGLELDKILKQAKESQEIKPVSYKSGDYVFSLLTPLVTKTFKNQVPAVKLALDLQNNLREYNKKFTDKIDFGISVHRGEMVNRLDQGKLKFTSLGNTLSTAKKIADVANSEVLLSKELHEKTIPQVKTEKFQLGELETFKVKEVHETDQNKTYIQDFLKRMAEAGKQVSK